MPGSILRKQRASCRVGRRLSRESTTGPVGTISCSPSPVRRAIPAQAIIRGPCSSMASGRITAFRCRCRPAGIGRFATVGQGTQTTHSGAYRSHPPGARRVRQTPGQGLRHRSCARRWRRALEPVHGDLRLGSHALSATPQGTTAGSATMFRGRTGDFIFRIRRQTSWPAGRDRRPWHRTPEIRHRTRSRSASAGVAGLQQRPSVSFRYHC